MKKELLDFVNELDDVKYYLCITESGIAKQGNFPETCTLLTMIMKQLMQTGLDEEDILRCLEIAKMSDKSLMEELKRKAEKLKEILEEK